MLTFSYIILITLKVKLFIKIAVLYPQPVNIIFTPSAPCVSGQNRCSFDEIKRNRSRDYQTAMRLYAFYLMALMLFGTSFTALSRINHSARHNDGRIIKSGILVTIDEPLTGSINKRLSSKKILLKITI
ncbi:hypothetical protein [Cronobacter condimenti]|uniref:hypothetical protein n=1 Tax=Cronobacter condimenti TaxID=1163710 RepID=UPI00100F4F72|nr:hypothetical protein [Cronobacter condimenti]